MQVLQLFLDKFLLKCKLQMKTKENERGILGKVEFGLTEMCFRSPNLQCCFPLGGGLVRCLSEILNFTPKGDHLDMAQAFCEP